MHPRRAAAYTALAFMCLFGVQVLWTQGRLEQLRQLGRRGLRTAGGARGARTAQPAAGGSTHLDALALHGVKPDGSATGGVGGAEGRPLMADPALIVFCFNRSDYLNQTLHSLLGLRGLEHYTVYVSQDGDAEPVAAVARQLAPAFLRSARGFEFWQKTPRVPALSEKQPGHAWLAQHYKWGLDRVFERRHSHVVIVEDDMLFSPDFLLYFEATAPLLDSDPTLWCISSWNDNGFVTNHEWDVRRMFRTSYFPGLGWMMRRQLWEELGPSWPLDHWDHWMRDEEVSKGRECVCPEINRNKNIGEVGANMNKQAFKRYLQTMSWNANETFVDYGDLSYLHRDAYEAALRAELAEAEPFEFSYKRNAPKPQPGKTYLVAYTIEQYLRVSLRLKLWPYPRGHFQHVAAIPWNGSRFLVADRRFCPLLPAEHQLPPTPGMTQLPGEQHQSCNEVCEARGMICNAKDFWWLNSCAVMRKHFPCEHGCIIELGPDVPAYVVDPAQTLFHYCLLTQKASLCAAKHAATARLCACVPPKEDSRRRLQGTAAVPGNSSAAAAAGAAAAVQQQPQPGTDLAIGGGPYTGRLRLP